MPDIEVDLGKLLFASNNIRRCDCDRFGVTVSLRKHNASKINVSQIGSNNKSDVR